MAAHGFHRPGSASARHAAGQIAVVLAATMLLLAALAIAHRAQPWVRAHVWQERSVAAYRQNQLRTHLRELEHGFRFDLHHATHLIHRGTTHSDDRRIRFTENWLQWSAGRFYEPLRHTQNTQRLIAGTLANCSERAQILKTFAETAGHPCRFIGLDGHVLLEVLTDHGWRVADPDYGVVFSMNFDALVRPENATFIQTALALADHAPDVVDQYVSLVGTTSDNVVLPVGQPLSPRLFLVEVACDWLVWLIPLLFLAGARVLR